MLDRRLLGWGVFFILVGAIPLATRAGLLDQAVVGRWPSLWPLLLVAWGVGLLLRRTPLEWIGGALSVTVFGVMGGGALAAGFGGVAGMGGCGGDQGGREFAAQRGTFAAAGQLNVELNCGSLVLGTADGSDWSVAGVEANGRAPKVVTDGSAVSIESESGGSAFGSGGGEARWTVVVPRAPELGLGLTLNAGEGAFELDGANLASVNLTLNAGSARLDLATTARLGDVNATVNAGSATIALPVGSRSANLSLNAGNLDVCLPAGTSLRVTWSGALGSNDLDDAGLVKVDGNTWTSPGFDAGQPHLELQVSANAGSFGLELGGVCDA